MIIMIDASRALHPQPTGIGWYCQEIIRALLDLEEARQHEWLLLAPDTPLENHPLYRLPDYAKWQIVPGRRAWTWLHLSWFFARHPKFRQAVFFVPGHTLPFITPKKSVVVIHDFAFRYFPEAYGRLKAWWLNHELARSAAKAATIIVPSLATARDLTTSYKTPAKQIKVIAHGVDHEHYQPLTEAEKMGLPAPIRQAGSYFLTLGRVEKRKNSRRILDAYREFRETNTETHTKLIFIGKPGYGWPEINTTYQQLPTHIKKDVLILGYQPTDLALLWLKNAQALIYPSLYEGFGLPILEAQAAGVPVLTSTASSMHEVADQAAIFVDPSNTSELTAGLNKLSTDRTLLIRLRQKGMANAQTFTWQKAAQQTLTTLLAVGEKK